MTFLVSRANPTAQIIVLPASSPTADFSIEVADVDAAHEAAVRRGDQIVYELRDEPWGVRRFFVRDPNGHTVNIVSHRS
ncbi:VOC family protein [Fodinicola feengrottensis]|uniref:VOC family protein n=1 Tax=Fodinicola feengrottensis TaxID=435914 RepID=UPI0013D2166A|nr:VOC family protein [Fodinicola feengrottensis]